MRRIFQNIFTGILLFIIIPAVHAQSVLPEDFDEWVEASMQQWDIPGMSVAMVKDGEIILTEGYGVLKLGEEQKVDHHTQFGIASVSKHMTASSLAILVDEGKISWNDKVIKHIPWFELSDPWVTANVTIHDLLTHQVGVGRMLGNRLQFMTDRSRNELLYRMRYLDFEQPFRSDYVYSNVMYTLAGEIVTTVSGQTWDEFMAERFFKPMGMNRTNTSINDLHSDGNAAHPHQYINGEVVTIPIRNWDVASPAGGVNSTAYDMAKWMLLQLNSGSFEGDQYISARSLQAIQTPQVSLGASGVDAPQRSYGYGYNITDYRGYRLLSHGGATDGMNTTYILLPEENLGIIVMTNVFNTFREAVARTIIDHVLDVTDLDWNELYLNSYKNQYEVVKAERETFEATRIPGTTTTHSLDAYAGRFYSSLYEYAEVNYEDGELILTIFDDKNLTADLEHWHHNTFRINWHNPAQREEFLQFRMNLEGEIDGVEIRYTLRPRLLQVGAYPSNYYRNVLYTRTQ
ncbi:MAG: serine hydrolase [Balneolaceae bacterium]|nr:MAG: serine hydrolase [Balneolaceae bacterium]